MKKLILLLACAAVYSISFAQTFTIKPCTTAPKIDGKIDTNDPYKASDLIPMTMNKATNSTSDISGKMFVTYDNSNLYIATVESGDQAIDTDATIITASYVRDCMEVFVKMDTTIADWTAAAAYIPGDYQFRQVRAAIFPDRFDNPATPSGGTAVDFTKEPGFKIAQVQASTGYTIEWQIPWLSLLKGMGDNSTNWTKKYIKYDEQLADCTGTSRTQQLFWGNNSDNQWDDTRTLTLVYLQTPVVLSASAVSNPTTTISYTITANEVIAPMSLDMEICNLMGQVVAKANNTKVMNISLLKAGVYFVRGTNNGHTYTQKFSKY